MQHMGVSQPTPADTEPQSQEISPDFVQQQQQQQSLRGLARSGQQFFGRVSESVSSFAEGMSERLNIREKEPAASVGAAGPAGAPDGSASYGAPPVAPGSQASGFAPPPAFAHMTQQQPTARASPNEQGGSYQQFTPPPPPMHQGQQRQPMQRQDQQQTLQQPSSPSSPPPPPPPQQQQPQQQQAFMQSQFAQAQPTQQSQQQPQLQHYIDSYMEISAGQNMDPSEFPRPERAEIEAPDYGPGNAPSMFLRPTVTMFPSSNSMKEQFGVPLGVVVQPLADTELPVASFDHLKSIPRCRKCRSYINPWFKWTDQQRRFVCNMCNHVQDIEPAYWSIGWDGDTNQPARPELACGSVEIEAGEEYMVRPPMPPTYLFVIDVSRNAVKSGTLADVVENVRTAIDDIHNGPGGDRARVGFLTFDSVLHVYSLREHTRTPQMMIVPDLQSATDTLPPDIIVNLDQNRGRVEAVLDIISEEFEGNDERESAFGPVSKAALSVMMARYGGKILLFQCTLPSIGPGKLQPRNDPKINGTDREHFLRVPADSYYKKLASECAKNQVCVDLFAFAVEGSDLDLASMSALAKYTGGSLYHYKSYPSRPGSREKFEHDLQHNINRRTGWEAVVRIRVGSGFKIRSFEGNYFMRSTDLIALPSPNCDQAFGIEIMHNEQSPAAANVKETYIQTALLYTTTSGARRIRIHTLRIPLARTMKELYDSVDQEALAALTARQAAGRSLQQKLSECRSLVIRRMSEGLRQFRLHVRQASRSPSKMVFPESMSLVPLYAMCILKSTALQGQANELPPDDRATSIFDMLHMPVDEAITYLCPRLFPVHLLPDDAGCISEETTEIIMPPPMPLMQQHIAPTGVYLADDARELLLWVGPQVDATLADELFGEGQLEAISSQPQGFLQLRDDTDLGQRVWRIVRQLQAKHTRHKPLVPMYRTRDGNALLQRLLIEDSGGESSVNIGSYASFLSHMHSHIQTQRSNSGGNVSGAGGINQAGGRNR